MPVDTERQHRVIGRVKAGGAAIPLRVAAMLSRIPGDFLLAKFHSLID